MNSEDEKFEVQRRAKCISSFANTDSFDKVADDFADLPAVLPDQAWFVWSLSHTNVPPMATTAMDAAIRVYGAFEHRDDAMHHAASLHAEDSAISIMVSRTNEWIAGVSSVDRLPVNDQIVKARLNCFLEQRRSDKDEFDRNVMDRTAGSSTLRDEPGAGEIRPDGAAEPTSRGHSKQLSDLGRVASQNLAVLSFIPDTDVSSCEFIFKVYGFVESQSEANRWVRNVLGEHVKDFDIDVVAAGRWALPQRMDNTNVPAEVYRSRELDSIMKDRRSQPQKVKAFAKQAEEGGV